MKISSFKIQVIFLILTVVGLFLLPKIGLQLYPNSKLPSITVNYSLATATAYTLERDVSSVLEAGFARLEGVSAIASKSAENHGYITLNFDKHTDIDVARFETATMIRQLYKQLPIQTSYPTIRINTPNDEQQRAFVSYSINALQRTEVIQQVVNSQIIPTLGAIKNIDQVQLYGATPLEYQIVYDNELLQLLKLTKQDLIFALQQYFTKESLGNVHYQDAFSTLTIQPKIATTDWHIPIQKVTAKIIYLDDVAQIRKTPQEHQNYYRVNGKDAITLAMYATKNANTIALAKEVQTKLKTLEKQLPTDYEIVKTYDSTTYLQQELNKVYERTLYTIFILFVFILLVSRSFKYLFITLLSIIANISVAFILYYAFRIQLQLYSLAGITISLGLIIDNSIVMMNHIRNKHHKSVFLPILASTLTTIGALSVIYFLEDHHKVNLIDFAYVIIINLGVSLLVALFLIPALLEKICLTITDEKNPRVLLHNTFYTLYYKLILVLIRFKKTVIIIIILVFGIPFFMLPQQLEKNDTWYEKAYNSSIGNDWYKENLRPYVDRYLGGSFRLFSHYVFDASFYEENEETKLFVHAAMEKGATVHQMNEVFLMLENDLQAYKELQQFTTSVYNPDNAFIEITFKEAYKETDFPFILKSRLIAKTKNFGGISWNIYGVGNGFRAGNSTTTLIDFSLKGKGYNYDMLNSWADTLKIMLEKNTRIKNVQVRENSRRSKNISYEYLFTLNKEQLARANVTPSQVFSGLQALTLSKRHDLFLNIEGEYTPIRFVSKTSKNAQRWHIENTIINAENVPIVLKNTATIQKQREAESIYKENQEYVRLVEFQYVGASKFGSQLVYDKLKELNKKLPLGYTFDFSDQNWYNNPKDTTNYVYLLLLIMGIIYLICTVLFESFTQPFIILSIIPVSFIGVFLTFYLFEFNFDQGGMASFILLSGITVNASIFIVNGFNILKKQFPNRDRMLLYVEAFQQKIIPILFTIISTILGFIPFIKDGQSEVFWFALGIGTIGGLLFSLLGILLYLPVFTLRKR
ncbi:efflux RND transporter permease subunit [Kordia sp.]|uniref:efflux RND transporter permease subunit n=1 Tax=Kordia sp. TaxID=1965332 RepID=UPI003D2D8CFC